MTYVHMPTLANTPETSTIPEMPKGKANEESANVQGRLKMSEIAELDRAAAEQAVPVTRAAMISHILREWLKANRQHSDNPPRNRPR